MVDWRRIALLKLLGDGLHHAVGGLGDNCIRDC